MRRPTFASPRASTIASAAATVGCAAALGALLCAQTAVGASGSPRCTTSGLVIWLNTTANGAAGSSFYSLYFTNLSRRACSLKGYPGVSAIDLSGRRLGRSAGREAGQAPAAVMLAPGATARAVLRIVDAANFSASACHEVTAAGLRVYAPGERRSKVVPFPFKTCSRTGSGVLSVRALTP